MPSPISDFDVEGKYSLVQPAQPTETEPGTVEVVDVFWFGCPACFRFLPHMEGLKEAAPDYLRIRRMPAVFRESWIPHARAYYTAHLLGVEDRIYPAMFEAIHVQGRSLSTRDALAAFFEEHGVSAGEFGDVYDSFAVESLVTKVRRDAAQLRGEGDAHRDRQRQGTGPPATLREATATSSR